MTTIATVDIGTLITRTPGVVGGRPCIDGTRTSVDIIAEFYNSGRSAEEIQVDFPHLTLAQVFAALAYYFANRETIDDRIARDQAFGEAMKEAFPNGWRDEPLPEHIHGMLYDEDPAVQT